MARLPDDVVVRIDNLYKDFHLPHENEDSIKHKVITVFRRKDTGEDVLHALRGISFDIKKGEFFGILGRNGSGKSTLLKIISQIYQPTKGTVSHRGNLVAFIELGVGFNPQLSGRENVYLNGALLGFSRKEIDAFYDEVVAFAELEDHMEKELKNYSSGMKVRLAFSVAIQANADILVLDEVLAVGDADFQRKCYNYFKDLKDEHKTIIFVSHSMGLVKEYCDRAILIEKGKITHEGVADEVADAYTSLFNKPKDEVKEQPVNRWGSGEIKFTSTSAHISEETLTVTLNIRASSDVSNVIVGMVMENSRDILTTGVPESAVASNKFDLPAGEKRTMVYKYKNYFGGGDFKISVSLKSPDGNYIYDFWKDACTFTNPKKLGDYLPSVYPLEVEVS